MTKTDSSATAQPFRFHFSLAWLLAYLTVMALVSGGLAYGRRQAIRTYGTTDAQSEWDTWRDDAREMTGAEGPVKRREPKSAEPPALVLMRDHFGACLGLALVLTSVLFGTFMIFVRGALSAPDPSRLQTPDSRPPLS